jgi:hypothetical protein
MKQLLPTLTPEERTELQDCLGAMDEEVSVEEFRAIRAALDEALMDPSPSIPIEQVYKDLEKWTRGDATAPYPSSASPNRPRGDCSFHRD